MTPIPPYILARLSCTGGMIAREAGGAVVYDSELRVIWREEVDGE